MLIKILVNALALAVAAWLVPGIHLSSEVWDVVLVALVFSLVNTFVRPLVQLLALPFILVTLGLMLVVINAFMLLLTANLTEQLSVDGLGSAILGSLVISLVGVLVGSGKERRES